MKTTILSLMASLAAAPLLAQETREMDAHVHGVSTLELAVEDGGVVIDLTSPGMDIVGFEYAAREDADKDAVEAAIRTMLAPENVVVLPGAAECRLTEVLAHLHDGENDHADDAHAHVAEDGHEAHAEDGDHAEDEDHAEEAGAEHSEFYARYVFACDEPDALTSLDFPFFASFENAEEIEAQYVTETGAGAAEIVRDAATLSLD